MAPASETQGILPSNGGLGLNLLGISYERQKNKLRQELQQDYKHYVATKKDLKTSEPYLQAGGLSLPIVERVSVQEKLREERNREYNLFLQQEARIRRLKRETPPATLKPGQVQAPDAVYIPSPAFLLSTDTHTKTQPPSTDHFASRKDAATLTEAKDYGKRTGTWGRRRWRLPRLKESSCSEEELIIDTNEDLGARNRRRQKRHTPEPENKKGRRTKKHRAKRTPQDIEEVKPPGVHHQNNNNEVLWKSDQQMLDSMKTATSSRPTTSKDKAEFATGLIIGATEERTASQMRKEQYKQELLKQIDEQQKNKIREKKLKLRVAATGATDPEKEPDQIKQFEAGNVQHDSWRGDISHMPGKDLKAVEKDPNPRPKDETPVENTERGAPAGQSHVDYSAALSQLTAGSGARAAQGVPSRDYLHEDYHRNFSSMLGQMVFPRVAGAPPPPQAPPTVTYDYKTPYDAAYYYYGTRNPLDPNLLYNQNGLIEGVQQPGNFHSPQQRPPAVRPRGSAESVPRATDQHKSDGELASVRAKQRRENALSYQEALKQQIKEREERKRREKEEKDRYDAKIEAEMMAYNPWGTSGGGAPIKDQKGDLVSDLDQMHRINEESHRNPKPRNRGQTQSFLIRDAHTPKTPDSHQPSGSADEQTQETHMQDRYKKELRQQIEENKQRKEEQREQMRIEAEKDEQRLAKQRAAIQQRFEEEQRQQKKIKVREERKRREKEEKDQYDAKIEAEMMAYNPWGASGGGAPIKDQKGDLVSDLDQMHRINEESHRNPKPRNRGQTQSFLIRDAHTPKTPDSHQPSGSADEQTQETHMQDRYKKELRQQIEENKQRKEEQREQMRILAEKDEKRLAKQRAIIQQRFEEQRERKKHGLKKQSWIHELQTPHQREVIETEEKVPERAKDREEKREQLSLEKEPSAPIPALQRRQTKLMTSRPPSVVSQLSSRTVSPVLAPYYPPAPAKEPQLKDGQQEVFRELSTLRRYLRREQRKLEAQMGQRDPQEIYYTPLNRRRGRPRVDAFEPANRQSGAAGVHMQNYMEFNHLKHRDTGSREEVRHMYPDPPTDDSSLDIQQQALLREQRKIRLKKRDEEQDFWDHELSLYAPRNKPGPNIHRDPMLPSESTFIDFHSVDAREEQSEQRFRQHSAEHQERTAPQRRHDYDEEAASVDQSNCHTQPDAQSLQSVTSLNPECKDTVHDRHCIPRQSSGNHNSGSEGLPGDEVDVLSLRSARERCVSMETIATEPWLRPGTSDAVKHSGCRETPKSRTHAQAWLTYRIT